MAKRKVSKRPRGRGPVRRRKKPAARAVEAALAGIAHDIRTPLTGIVALAELLAALVSVGVEPVRVAVLVNVPALVATAVSASA